MPTSVLTVFYEVNTPIYLVYRFITSLLYSRISMVGAASARVAFCALTLFEKSGAIKFSNTYPPSPATYAYIRMLHHFCKTIDTKPPVAISLRNICKPIRSIHDLVA